jgi:hypothetical protein
MTPLSKITHPLTTKPMTNAEICDILNSLAIEMRTRETTKEERRHVLRILERLGKLS